jgi:hypothetical protein
MSSRRLVRLELKNSVRSVFLLASSVTILLGAIGLTSGCSNPAAPSTTVPTTYTVTYNGNGSTSGSGPHRSEPLCQGGYGDDPWDGEPREDGE